MTARLLGARGAAGQNFAARRDFPSNDARNGAWALLPPGDVDDGLLMSILRRHALVLDRVPFGNSSWVVSFLCPEVGKLTLLAKGARRIVKKGMFERHLDLFCAGEIVYFPSAHGLGQLAEFGCAHDFPGLRTREERLAAAYALVDLARSAAQPDDPHETLYEALLDALCALEVSDAPARAFFCGWLSMLRALGLLADSECCAECQATLGDRRRDRAHSSAFVVGRSGGFLCQDCTEGDTMRKRVPEGVRLLWMKFADQERTLPAKAKLSLALRRDFLRILAAYTAAVAGITLPSLAALKHLWKSETRR